MAGEKISQLPASSSARLTDLLAEVQSGTTQKLTIQQLVTLLDTVIQLGSSAQVTGLDAQLATYLSLAGGTMAGPLILWTSNPATSLEAASKGYVDTVAAGFTIILACQYATTANLNATYSNGSSGVGATLTDASGTFAAFTVDGASPSLNTRILVRNQTTTSRNGIYVLTTNGNGISVPWVLTRATDYDQAAEIKPGTLVAVNAGTVNANTSWLETATVVTVGTDPVLFSQFTFAPGAFLMVANNLSDVASVSTSRTNLGLGSVATKTASDASKTNAAMVNGSTTAGHLAIFADTAGTVEDGGAPLSLSLNDFADGRLTFQTGVPVTAAPITAATAVYYTPYVGNHISLFDGSSTWNTLSFTELSIAIPGTANTAYDVFVYNNSGTATLELQPWTNQTTRAVALVYQDGVLVKNGATTRRYVGSFSTTATMGQSEDSLTGRLLWNYYNRIKRAVLVTETTASWTYSTASYRQVNGNVANQFSIMIGVVEDTLDIHAFAQAFNSTATNRFVYTGIGINSSTVNSAVINATSPNANDTTTANCHAVYNAVPSIGVNSYLWLEKGAGGDTQTWNSQNNGAGNQLLGMYGFVFA